MTLKYGESAFRILFGLRKGHSTPRHREKYPGQNRAFPPCRGCSIQRKFVLRPYTQNHDHYLILIDSKVKKQFNLIFSWTSNR